MQPWRKNLYVLWGTQFLAMGAVVWRYLDAAPVASTPTTETTSLNE
jgi:hypothetical protein